MSTLPEGKLFSIGEKQFNFSVATTALDCLKGLAGVNDLEPYEGMLFDFGTSWPIIMTPKGLKFPVEVAFISEEGLIREIKKLDPENGFTQASTENARFALEVPVGFFERNAIQINDILAL